MLSKLRKLQSVVKEEEDKMAIDYDMESDFRFVQGKEAGKELGEIEGELKGEIKLLDKLFNDGTITEEKYKVEVEPLRKKLEELSKGKN